MSWHRTKALAALLHREADQLHWNRRGVDRDRHTVGLLRAGGLTATRTVPISVLEAGLEHPAARFDTGGERVP